MYCRAFVWVLCQRTKTSAVKHKQVCLFFQETVNIFGLAWSISFFFLPLEEEFLQSVHSCYEKAHLLDVSKVLTRTPNHLMPDFSIYICMFGLLTDGQRRNTNTNCKIPSALKKKKTQNILGLNVLLPLSKALTLLLIPSHLLQWREIQEIYVSCRILRERQMFN